MKKRFFPFVLVLLLVSAAAAFELNPRLTGLPDNTWMILDTTGIQFDGHTAYSGGTYDRTNHQFLIFGGGHWDGWKNDVLAFDVSKNTWKSMYTPTPQASYNCGNVNSTTPGMLLAEHMPASRHTWDGMEFIDHLGKMIVWSQATYSGIWSCPGNTLPADTWLYDYATNTWEYKNAARGAQPYGEGGAGAYDPVGKLYYAVIQDKQYFQMHLWVYSAEADRWTETSPTGTTPSVSDANIITDRKRQVLYDFPHRFDIKTHTWSTMTGTPSGLSGGYGTVNAYDEVNDAMVFLRDGTIYVYHIAAQTWETLHPAGAPAITREYGRFFYDPVDNVHLLVLQVSYRARTYAYRYKGSAPMAAAKKSGAAVPAAMTASPNPFSGSTVITLKKGKGVLRIFDIRGRQVAAFGSEKGGSHFVWNGKDAKGQRLPRGLYFLQAKAGNKTSILKLFLK